MIAGVLDGLAANGSDNGAREGAVLGEVRALCRRFPIYPA